MFRKLLKSSLLPVLAIGMAVAFVACSSGSKSYTVTSTGDSITSASLEKTSDGYKITMAPIVDRATNEPLGESDSSAITAKVEFDDAFTAKLSDSALPTMNSKLLACTLDVVFGSGTASKADLAFLVDTTGSMGSAVEGIINSIQTFADSLAAADLDVMFSLVTFGDAYNTKAILESDYTLGTGVDLPPTFDTDERPLIDFTDVASFKAFATEVKTNVGSGAGGGDSAENYYATVMAMAGLRTDQPGLSTRDGVPYYQILVGDDCAHTQESPGDTADLEGSKWIPDPKADVSKLAGKVTVHVVKSTDSCSPDQLSLSDIADATGGAKLALGSGDVDLASIDLAKFITSFWIISVDKACVSSGLFNLIFTLTVTDGVGERTQIFTFVESV